MFDELKYMYFRYGKKDLAHSIYSAVEYRFGSYVYSICDHIS